MKEPKEGGGRVAIVMNGSPLFTGDAGSGESEIRRWILENDWLEAIVALPDQLFYNTGISTYVWILSNRKDPRRKGKVQLIDATSSFWVPMRKSLGNKRHEISAEQIQQMTLRSKQQIEQQNNPPGSVHAAPPAAKETASKKKEDDEVQGVFVIRSRKAVFVPVATGITGTTDMEVLDGLKEGDEVVTGSYKILRTLRPGASVKVDNTAPKKEEEDS